ncbi:hypothetical protein ACT691_02865 [Vibrio metschnikovii]
MLLTMGSLRSDTAEMGGKAYRAETGQTPDWRVTTCDRTHA